LFELSQGTRFTTEKAFDWKYEDHLWEVPSRHDELANEAC
jgi:hypothetical protein